MNEVIGIDHIYITVSDLAPSGRIYDVVLIDTLGFRKSSLSLGGDPHVQHGNRHFGFVLRPAHVATQHEPYSPGLHHFCFRVDSIEDVHTGLCLFKETMNRRKVSRYTCCIKASKRNSE